MSTTIKITSIDGATGTPTDIGVIQSFKPTDSRKMERARGVGFGDRVAEIVPGLTDVTITVSRMALYTKNILETFGYTTKWNTGTTQGTVRTLAHMKNPFDVHETIFFHNNGTPTTVTMYHDCWMSNWARSIDISGNLIYMEDVNIDVTWVDDGMEPGQYAQTDMLTLHGLCSNSPTDAGTNIGFNAGSTTT
jgi:hypothetical protein